MLADGVLRQSEVVARLRAVLPAESVLWQREDTRPYECDGLSAYRQLPMVVALPRDEAEVAAVMRICSALKVPLVARGAGTGLSGGAYPHAGGVLLSLARMRRILQLDPLAPSPRRRRRMACTTPRIRPRRSPVPLAAMWPRTPVVCIASSTA